ncbi:M23 family metallopeptidase [Streptomyces sp. TG1A-8]|uniref:murein hydrolase activator EnvC family protein n=1 Tax=Streptomyces sp. TG1A-8 TaxID=3051385 RepID=UPI00265C11E2|nr:M23 family metallopeptidase [Streptomyces sp. TG1A-8]MDO0925508.1 M23 family metallopeptidase [Streptomyces sp. TG1A-8]
MRRVKRRVKRRTTPVPALRAAPLLAAAVALLTPPARAQPPPPAPPPPPRAPVPAVARAWPVGVRPTVVRGWEPPATAYGPGHRGVDLDAAPGTPVRAVAAGRVAYAGRVAGRGVVSVELAGTDLRTTYEPVLPSVEKGERVAAGEVVGTVERTGPHCRATCVHWGLLRGGAYLDPLSLLPSRLLRRGPSRLLPVLGVPVPARPPRGGVSP